jgi:hypothetical protein
MVSPNFKKGSYVLDMGSFWPLDKFLIRADILKKKDSTKLWLENKKSKTILP